MNTSTNKGQWSVCFTCCLSCVSCSFINSHLRLDSVASLSSCGITAESDLHLSNLPLIFSVFKCFNIHLIFYSTQHLATWGWHKENNLCIKKRHMCTYKVSFSLLLLLNLLHHFSDSLQLGVHKLLLKLLVLEHFVYILPDKFYLICQVCSFEVL